MIDEFSLLLFVYGSLRRGCSTGAHHRYLDSATWVASGRVRGKLYRVDTYPGLIPDGGEHWVAGEIYQLSDWQALVRLDDYEGCGDHHPEPREYRREKVLVELSSGASLETWGYYYNWQIDEGLLIRSGDFLNP
jgi:gamma-glutamylcyclotransferase (GGCT)/AIG2-like uncharacterized protein YtfP